jgi:K+-sensing histidine kinase KdpD
VLVAASGGSGSPFYYVYFIVLISNSIRYGMAMAMFVALLFNIAYVAVLVARPVPGDLTSEGVKILIFWGVALYAGYLAARYQRQARILEAYEETIEELRSRLESPAGLGAKDRGPS